jgi:hypothetical protein
MQIALFPSERASAAVSVCSHRKDRKRGRFALKSGHFLSEARLPSPWRHIYNPLTIAVAFRHSGAFDRLWQQPIKVDGTFA